MRKFLTVISFVLIVGCKPEPQPNEMRFHSVNNLPVVTVDINGKSGRLLVDTGASVSIIHAKEAGRYGFSTGKAKDPIFGIGGGSDALTAYNVRVSYRDSIINTDFIALDIADVKRNVGVVGILGSDWLNRNKITIDYKTKTLKR